jgi:hypothetical protein
MIKKQTKLRMADLCFVDTKTHALLLTSFREGVYWLERHLKNATRPRLHALDLAFFPLITDKLQTSASNAELIQALTQDVVRMHAQVKLLADDGLAAYEAFLKQSAKPTREFDAATMRCVRFSRNYDKQNLWATKQLLDVCDDVADLAELASTFGFAL